jgi:hypothetical protein
VDLSATRDGSGDITFTWTRRSHADPNGWSANVPALDYAPEAWRLTIFDGAAPVRTIETASPAATYTAAEQTADFGAAPAAFSFAIAQVSLEYGPGHVAEGEFHD